MTKAQSPSDDEIIKRQTAFYNRNRAGCAFAAYAARDPTHYRWHQRVCPASAAEIDEMVAWGIVDENVATLSLIFPDVKTDEDLRAFLLELRNSKALFLEMQAESEGRRCLGYRARVGELTSWISGFGPFPGFPKTRQAPFVELAMRVKPRPDYDEVMKEAPEGVIHLADMNMKGLRKTHFKRLWDSSFERTAKLLGHTPDLASAAKTTFVVPAEWDV